MSPPEADSNCSGDPTLTERAEALFCELIELDAPQRSVQLDARCGDDHVLRDAVRRLLQHHDDPPSILSKLTSAAPAANPAPTTRLGKYTILETIGRGGMGIVYRARQDRPNRVVALKVLSPTLVDVESVERFDREIEVLGLLHHPGICHIHEAGSAELGLGLGQVLFFAMEYVDGLPLGRFAQLQQLDRRARCALVAQVCDAVQHAHERGVVHRDLKPTNILVVAGPQGPQPKVLDFGIARTLAPELAQMGKTRTGSLLGTPQYMSPEQLEGGAASADARCDVYALGVMLYELLAGRPPLELTTGSLADVVRIVREREPLRLGRIDSALRGDLEVIVAKALAKRREERYASAAELAADLRRHLRGEPILAQAQTTMHQLRSFARRHRGLVGGTLAVLVSLLFGIIGVSILAHQNRGLAEREAMARGQAEGTSERLRRALYGAQMRLDSAAFTFPGGVAQARTNLSRWVPQAGAVDMRGFEWDLLHSLCNEAVLVQPCAPRPFDLYWLSDGRSLFSSHWHVGVHLDAATGTALATYPTHAQPVGHARLSDDQQTLLLSMTPEVLVSVDRQTGATLCRFEHESEVTRVALSRDGTQLATNVVTDAVLVWDVRNGAHLATLRTRGSGVVAISQDGKWLAVDQASGTLQVWRWGSWSAPHRVLQVPEEYVMDVAFAPSGDALATASSAGCLRLHQLADSAASRSWQHAAGLRRIAFAPRGDRIAVASEDYAAYVHDLGARGDTRRLAGHAGNVVAIAFSPDGTRVATEADDHTLRIWDLRLAPTVSATTVVCGAPPYEHQLAWSRDGARVAVHVAGTTNQSWSPASDNVVPGFVLDNGRVRVGNYDNSGLVATHTDGRERQLATTHLQVAALSSQRVNLALGERGRVRLIDLAGDQPEHVIAIHDVCRGLAFMRDGRRVACVDGSDLVRVIDVETGQVTARRKFPEGALELDCAPNSDLIAVACVDQTIRLWSPATDAITEMRGHLAHVCSVAFSPDGTRLASGSQDRSVKIWWVAEGSELLTLPHTHTVSAVAWRPDGRALASLDCAGQLKVWNAAASNRGR